MNRAALPVEVITLARLYKLLLFCGDMGYLEVRDICDKALVDLHNVKSAEEYEKQMADIITLVQAIEDQLEQLADDEHARLTSIYYPM